MSDLRRCERHGLVHPYGQECVLCRRYAAPASALGRKRPPRLVVMLHVLVLSIATIAVLALVRLKASEPEGPSLAASVTPAVLGSPLTSATTPAARPFVAAGATAAADGGSVEPPWPDLTTLLAACKPSQLEMCRQAYLLCTPETWAQGIAARRTTPQDVRALAVTCRAKGYAHRDSVAALCIRGDSTMCDVLADVYKEQPIRPEERCRAGDTSACRELEGERQRRERGRYGPRNCSDSMLVCLMAAAAKREGDPASLDPTATGLIIDNCVGQAPRCSQQPPTSVDDNGCCPDACVSAYRRARSAGVEATKAMDALNTSGCDPRSTRLTPPY